METNNTKLNQYKLMNKTIYLYTLKPEKPLKF